MEHCLVRRNKCFNMHYSTCLLVIRTLSWWGWWKLITGSRSGQTRPVSRPRSNTILVICLRRSSSSTATSLIGTLFAMQPLVSIVRAVRWMKINVRLTLLLVSGTARGRLIASEKERKLPYFLISNLTDMASCLLVIRRQWRWACELQVSLEIWAFYF